MKTIEQAAQEHYAETAVRIICDEKLECIFDFKAGVKFAQQWINVDDKMPPTGEIILVKFYDGTIGTAVYEYNRWRTSDREYNWTCRPTHWRLIELK